MREETNTEEVVDEANAIIEEFEVKEFDVEDELGLDIQ
jgi:hypothetical protein